MCLDSSMIVGFIFFLTAAAAAAVGVVALAAHLIARVYRRLSEGRRRFA